LLDDRRRRGGKRNRRRRWLLRGGNLDEAHLLHLLPGHAHHALDRLDDVVDGILDRTLDVFGDLSRCGLDLFDGLVDLPFDGIDGLVDLLLDGIRNFARECLNRKGKGRRERGEEKFSVSGKKCTYIFESKRNTCIASSSFPPRPRIVGGPAPDLLTNLDLVDCLVDPLDRRILDLAGSRQYLVDGLVDLPLDRIDDPAGRRAYLVDFPPYPPDDCVPPTQDGSAEQQAHGRTDDVGPAGAEVGTGAEREPQEGGRDDRGQVCVGEYVGCDVGVQPEAGTDDESSQGGSEGFLLGRGAGGGGLDGGVGALFFSLSPPKGGKGREGRDSFGMLGSSMIDLETSSGRETFLFFFSCCFFTGGSTAAFLATTTAGGAARG
jgi:hypothetical protein